MEIWLFDPGHEAERSRKADRERGGGGKGGCVCVFECVFIY